MSDGQSRLILKARGNALALAQLSLMLGSARPARRDVLSRRWRRYRISSDLGEKLAPEVSANGSAPVAVEHAHPDAVRRAGSVYAAPEQHGSGAPVIRPHFMNDVVGAVEKLHSVLHGRLIE